MSLTLTISKNISYSALVEAREQRPGSMLLGPVLHVIDGLYLMKCYNQNLLWNTPETLDISVATLK